MVRKLWRLRLNFRTLVAGVLSLAGAALLGLYFWSPRFTLRVTTGPEGGAAHRLISSYVSITNAAHPHIRMEGVEVPDLEASSKALEDGKVDIALVRSDVSPPINGATLVILRRDVIAIVLAPESPIKNVAQLAGKTVVIPTGPLQEENSRALNVVLEYFNVPAASVKRLFAPLTEIAATLREKKAVAALAVGPVGPGQAVDVVAAIAHAFKGAPELLALDEAEAIAKRYPGFEAIDVPEGAFKAHPPTPADSTKGVAVSFRFVAPMTMLNVVAAGVTRSVLRAKGKFMSMSPQANQIEAPDPDANDPVLPIHPGVAAYLSTGDQSFIEAAQGMLTVIGLPLSLAAPVAGFLIARWRNQKLEADQKIIGRVLLLSDEALKADAHTLGQLRQELHAIVASCVVKLASGKGSENQWPLSLAIGHARHAILGREAELRAAVPATAHTLPETCVSNQALEDVPPQCVDSVEGSTVG